MNSTAENRLARESSPYLRQHAKNPVDWNPWGEEALARARAEGKPIFLSIGYAACHWCHVMERESFEDPAIAELLNANFINIKVDREERPDVDQIYMAAVVAMTRHGGWPMSVFLTPDQRPFYAGTYFPPEDRYGMPSFRRVLQGVISAWQTRREEVLTSADEITAHLRDAATVATSDIMLSPELLRGALHQLRRTFDPQYGGFGQAPKFPHPLEIRLLFRCWKRFQDETAKDMALQTLDRMAAGGIYDQLGGGFHRYSTDARWLVPHFEKMLYDNALLVPAYLDVYLVTKELRYRRVVEQTLDWWASLVMVSPDGAFYSTEDADSEGEEGKFYVWSQAEIDEVLGTDAEFFASVYDVSTTGNWEGHNILHRPKTDEQDAKLLGMTPEDLRARLEPLKKKLLAARAKRVRPGLDDKYLTAWNGLMISAFAQAAQVLDGKYAAPAVKAMEFVLKEMRSPEGRLYRTASPSQPAKLNGYLEDYSFILNALVDLYETTFDRRWIEQAANLTGVMIDQFWDETEGGLYFVGKDHESLILRNKEPQDNAVPSGNSMAALALLRLGKLCDRTDWTAKAERTLRLFAGLMEQQPMAFGQMLAAVDFHLGPVREYVVAGGAGAPETNEALQVIRAGYEPNRLVLAANASDAATVKLLPLLAGKGSVAGAVTTYLCEDSTCAPPLVGVAALRQRLAEDQS